MAEGNRKVVVVAVQERRNSAHVTCVPFLKALRAKFDDHMARRAPKHMSQKAGSWLIARHSGLGSERKQPFPLHPDAPQVSLKVSLSTVL